MMSGSSTPPIVMGGPNIPPPPPMPEEISMQPEVEVASWTPFRTRGHGSGLYVLAGVLIVIGLIALVPALPVGIIFILLGALIIAFKVIKGREKVLYVLTNRRAIVYSIKGKERYELQSCELKNAVVSVLNRQQISESVTRGTAFGGGGVVGVALAAAGVGGARTVGQANVVGDVVFMVGGIPQVKFVGVQDPDGIAQTANQLILNLRGT